MQHFFAQFCRIDFSFPRQIMKLVSKKNSISLINVKLYIALILINPEKIVINLRKFFKFILIVIYTVKKIEIRYIL